MKRPKRKKRKRFLKLLALSAAAAVSAALLCRATDPEPLPKDPAGGEASPAPSLSVQSRSQLPDYPTGCEAVSAAMLCDFFGIPFDTETFVESYLPKEDVPHEEDGVWVGGDMWEAFLGDPRSEDGWGCYSTALAPALSAYIEGSGYRAKAVRGKDLETLARETVGSGAPAIVWITIGMEAPRETTSWTVEATGEKRTWVYPMHCALLIGCDRTGYLFNDPLAGTAVRYPKEQVEISYDALFRQAVVLEPVH